MNDSRFLTNWSSSKTYNLELMKKSNSNNFSEYRAYLQNNTDEIINNTIDTYEKTYRCVSNNNNKFYLDSSNYNKSFDTANNVNN
jgi:hypothetical protein